MGATGGAVPDFTVVRVARSLIFCVVFGPESGHLLHRYSSTNYQVMVATVKPSKLCLQLYHKETLVQ
jgi:hypothetical protein